MDQNNKNEIKEVFQEIAGVENNKIWSTLKGLTLRPGKLISEYIDGTNRNVLNPIAYYFLIFAICSYLSNVSGYSAALYKYNKEFTLGMARDFNIPLKESTMETVERSNDFLESDFVNSLILLPFTLLLQWLVFRKFNSSFKANAWFNLFTTGHYLLLSIPLQVLFWRLTGNIIPVDVPLLAYIVWAAIQFYNIKLFQACIYYLLFLMGDIIFQGVTSYISAALFALLKHLGL